MHDQDRNRSAAQRRNDDSPFAGLTPYPDAGIGSELLCGDCQQPRQGLATYSVLSIVFLLFFVVWRVDSLFRCPSCMRGYLLRRLPLSLLLATVFAPVILVWWAILFVRTLGR